MWICAINWATREWEWQKTYSYHLLTIYRNNFVGARWMTVILQYILKSASIRVEAVNTRKSTIDACIERQNHLYFVSASIWDDWVSLKSWPTRACWDNVPFWRLERWLMIDRSVTANVVRGTCDLLCCIAGLVKTNAHVCGRMQAPNGIQLEVVTVCLGDVENSFLLKHRYA